MPLIFGLQFEHDAFRLAWLNGVMLACIAGLMVSRLPTFAFKRLKVPGRHVVFVLLGVGAFAAFLISTPWVTLGVAGLATWRASLFASHLYRRRRTPRRRPGRNAEPTSPKTRSATNGLTR